MNLVPLFEEAIEFQNYNGSVLSNGKVAVFYIGRTRLADIFNDIEGLSPAENPKVLDNLGMGPLYVNPAFDYEIIVYDAYDNEMFSVKKYLHSKGEHSTANVVVTPSENIAVSAWTIGDVQVYMPYLTGDVGKTYEGIDPIVVNNEYNRISANHIPLGVQDPLYFVEDSESACIIGCSAQTEIPSALSSKWNEASDAVIANSAQWAEGTEYKAGSYVDIADNTISVTGLQPEGDYAYNSALSSKLDVTALPQDLVHNGDLTAYQPAGNYQTAGNYLSATDSAKFYPIDNPSGFITGVDLTDYATTAQLDEKLNKSDSGNFYPMTGNPSGFINELPSDLATTGFVADVSANITAIIPTGDSNTISYNAKPTDKPIYASANELINVDSIQGKNNLSIIPSSILQVPNVLTAVKGDLIVQNTLTAVKGYLSVQNAITASPNDTLNVPGVITSNLNGLTAAGLSADTTYGLIANGLTADVYQSGFSANGISAGKRGPLCIEGQAETIFATGGSGFTFSSQNTAFGTAQLGIAQGNSVVQMTAPKFEARNISGAGFSIEASGAKGYNESGNVVWDTQNPQVKNIISYVDTKTAQGGLNGNIILTTQPSTNASNLTSSPYVIMDANQASYFAAYGPSAQTPTVSMNPSQIKFELQAGNTGKTTVGYNDIKQELSGSAWTLTGSVQKRELEYDAETSAITAIAGSAIGGQGGGGSVSSKFGTISVDGSNIEATNKAIEFKGKGFNSSFASVSFENNQPVVLTWDDYSQETNIHVEFYNDYPEDATLTYSSNTNVTGVVTTAANSTCVFNVPIPNATAIQFTPDNVFSLQYVSITAPSSFKVSELAWKSDLPTYTYNSSNKLSAINGSALVGNEDYLIEQGFVKSITSPKGTIKVLNNNKIEGTNSAIASDVIEGFVSSYNNLPVYPGTSATLSWERYVPNTILHISGKFQDSPATFTYSADTNVTGQIYLPDSAETSIEVPTNVTSIVIGTETFDNPNPNFTVSAADCYEVGELAWASAIPTYEYDSTNKISAINGSALASQGGGELPESVSAATDYVTANSANIDATVSNVSANSGAWGGSALPISAGPGIKFEMVDNTLVASTQGPILDKITIAGTWNGHEVKQMLQSGIFETNVNSDVIPVNSAYSAASSKWINPSNSYIQYGSTSNILPSTWVLGATGRIGSLSLLNGIVKVRSNDTTNTQCTAFVTIKWCEN